MNHTRWKPAREKRLAEEHTESAEVAAERAEIRLAMALNASLNIALDDDHEEVTFTAHPAA
jgi:hypothetical protein